MKLHWRHKQVFVITPLTSFSLSALVRLNWWTPTAETAGSVTTGTKRPTVDPAALHSAVGSSVSFASSTETAKESIIWLNPRPWGRWSIFSHTARLLQYLFPGFNFDQADWNSSKVLSVGLGIVFSHTLIWPFKWMWASLPSCLGKFHLISPPSDIVEVNVRQAGIRFFCWWLAVVIFLTRNKKKT